MTETLPVDSAVPALLSALDRGSAVLTAPPGSGKTTRVPLALLAAPWLDGRRILMLEPRRLAARAAAGYMARLLGEAVGETVGYRMRMDTRIGPRTRIEVVTEGVLTRMLQEDPALDDVGVVIFDEFHERSLHADLGLALSLQSQALLRPDLRLLVMSATLDLDTIAAVLGDAPVIRAEGRMHPVETRYAATRVTGHIEPAVAATVRRAVAEHTGDVLVFLPGTAEIRRTAERLAGADLPRDVTVMPLYGDLPQDAQDRAIAPSPPGSRKVVLATAIAETSLTIEGVRVVVDSGLMRVPRFAPRTGMTRLETVPVSRAAADQRRGRAGRVAPGVCYRLWTEADHAALLAHRPPEILEADLAPLALELAAWGIIDPGELRWLDAPSAAAFAQAQELLRELGALDGAGRITHHGRALAGLALHPRLAHMLVRGLELGAAGTAAQLAALLAERDILRAPDTGADPDVRIRMHVLEGGAPPHGHTVDRAALHRVRAEARQWLDRARQIPARNRPAGPGAPTPSRHDVDDLAGVLLAFAYPDRIGQQRGGRGRYLLRNGRGAAIDPSHAIGGSEFIVAGELGGHGRDSRIFLAAPIRREDLTTHFADDIVTAASVGWDGATQGVRAVATERLGALLLAERPLRDVPADALAAAVADGIRTHGLALLRWDRDAERLRQRLAFLHALDPGTWPAVDDDSLLAELDDWLGPFLGGVRNAAALQRVDVREALMNRVGWQRRAALDELAPTHVDVPSGSRIPIDYSDPAAPVLAVRLQEMFGLADTPRIAAGAVALTLHLMSPAHRPVQVTKDLASFWESAYFEVRRDLRGRYPRHYWPENPLDATATRRAKPRGG
ncbi:MAG TPA: ATP-dependent helicase HrpB [Longimicrobiales bacterium]|nr:ATP-dependent helicase HrpB [Longimicrobiales bacterium]